MWLQDLVAALLWRDPPPEVSVTDMKVKAVARLVVDTEGSKSDWRLGARWYHVVVGDHKIGRVAYRPDSHWTRAWEAHYPPSPLPSSGAFRSRRRAVQALVSRSCY